MHDWVNILSLFQGYAYVINLFHFFPRTVKFSREKVGAVVCMCVNYENKIFLNKKHICFNHDSCCIVSWRADAFKPHQDSYLLDSYKNSIGHLYLDCWSFCTILR